MIAIFKVRTKINYIKKIHKFCDSESIFAEFLAQTNVQIDRQTNFKLSRGTLLTIVSS